MNQFLVASAMFMQTLAPASQQASVVPDPGLNMTVPVVETVGRTDDPKTKDPGKPDPNKAEKGKLRLVFSGVSHHFGWHEFNDGGQMRHFNEVNPGVGVEYGLGKAGPFNVYATAGVYKNSMFRTSKYVALGIETNPSKFLGAGIEGGLLTGYPDLNPPIAAIPYFRVGEEDKVNLKVNVIPPIKGMTPATVGVQVRVPIGPK